MGGLTVEGALRRVPMFSGLPEEKPARVSESGYQVRLEAGPRIVTEGDPADGFDVIPEGETKWTRRIVRDRHGGDIRVDSGPGETRFTVRLPLEPGWGDGRRNGRAAS